MTRYIAFVLLLCASARADSLEEQRWKTDKEKQLQANTDSMNKSCGTTMTSRIDWSVNKYDENKRVGIQGILSPINGLQRACGTGDDAKAAVRKAIKTIVIKPGTKETTMELANGEFHFNLAIDHFIPMDDVKSWLLKHL